MSNHWPRALRGGDEVEVEDEGKTEMMGGIS